MATKKEITKTEAIELVKSMYSPNDYNCDTWEQVFQTADNHVDGFAAALEIDDEYIIIY